LIDVTLEADVRNYLKKKDFCALFNG